MTFMRIFLPEGEHRALVEGDGLGSLLKLDWGDAQDAVDVFLEGAHVAIVEQPTTCSHGGDLGTVASH